MLDKIKFDGLADDVIAAIKIPEPDFYMPMTSGLSIDKGIGTNTFTRSSTATYIDMYGELKTAEIDEPRCTKDGLLVEPQSTNLCPLPYATPDGDRTYYYWNSTHTRLSTETTAGAGGFDVTVNKLIMHGRGYLRLRNGAGVKPRGYATSLFVKGASQDIIVQGIVAGYTGNSATISTDNVVTIKGTINVQVIQLANGWRRIGAYDAEATEALAFEFADGETIYTYGGQIEELPFTSSYIPTNGAPVTRATDIPCVNMRMPQTCTIALDIHPLGKATGGNRIVTSTDGAGHSGLYRLDTRGGYYSLYGFGDGALTAQTRVEEDTPVSLIFTRDQSKGERKNYLNANLTATTAGYDMTSKPTRIFLGSAANGSDSMRGYIKNFRMWFNPLTDEQVRGIN